MSASHTIMDGKVHLYRRGTGRYWQCAVFLSGTNYRQSTRQENLAYAIEFARDWFLDRVAEDRLRRRGMEPPPVQVVPGPARFATGGHKFRDVAAQFLREYEVLTQGERSPKYVARKESALRVHLNPFFGALPISEVNAAKVQEYRVHRMSPPQKPTARRLQVKGRQVRAKPLAWKQPSRSCLHNEIVCLRQILKFANRKGWIHALPDMSAPYRSSAKVSHRAWFSPTEYGTFLQAVRSRAANPKRDRWRGECEQFLDYVEFMVATGLRPDEASRLQYRDVAPVLDRDTRQRILEIEVRGKRGTGYCKSMPEAVEPFLRMKARNAPRPDDIVFGKVQRELMNTLLHEVGLKEDREGNPRTAYSLRHTYICFRLLEGADIYQLAKNCRTSVEMIEKFYAAHLKNAVDASAINLPREGPRTVRRGGRRAGPS